MELIQSEEHERKATAVIKPTFSSFCFRFWRYKVFCFLDNALQNPQAKLIERRNIKDGVRTECKETIYSKFRLKHAHSPICLL